MARRSSGTLLALRLRPEPPLAELAERRTGVTRREPEGDVPGLALVGPITAVPAGLGKERPPACGGLLPGMGSAGRTREGEVGGRPSGPCAKRACGDPSVLVCRILRCRVLPEAELTGVPGEERRGVRDVALSLALLVRSISGPSTERNPVESSCPY